MRADSRENYWPNDHTVFHRNTTKAVTPNRTSGGIERRSLGGLQPRCISDNHRGVRAGRGERQVLLAEHLDVLLYAPASLVQAIRNGVADTGETDLFRRVKGEERRVLGSLDLQ
jgi:hypothetical protein